MSAEASFRRILHKVLKTRFYLVQNVAATDQMADGDTDRNAFKLWIFVGRNSSKIVVVREYCFAVDDISKLALKLSTPTVISIDIFALFFRGS